MRITQRKIGIRMVQQTNKEKKIYLVADHAQINIEILYIEIT